ncbi:MAG: valine--tRNA ligase, partial [Candidatus Pacebacteria bacterium]|nr:valine--tRNA ligase [Candidatus Paceibacterota bacterium]
VINSEIRKDLTQADFKVIEENTNVIESLAGTKSLEFKTGAKKPEGWVHFDCRASCYVNIGDLIDTEKEAERIKKEIESLKKYTQQIRTKLGNDNFVVNAPREVVEKERNKFMVSEEKLRKLEEKLKSL